MIDRWIAEATECDFKVALEVKKPKSWLKSVSAFANGIGGTLFFGIDNDRNVVGLADAQNNAEAISRLIKERITPYPSFILAPEQEDGKDILVLSVSAGRSTPYYYKADGIMEAYIRIGNESVIAPSYVLNQLILKGMHRTYDELVSEYDFKDYAFSKLRERYKAWTGNSMEEKLFDSFDMRDEHGKLTNAGALLADDSPIRHSRLFCTRWNGLDKSGGMVDALDSAEFSGSLIILLNEGVSFVKRNMKTRWKKTADSRVEMPDCNNMTVLEPGDPFQIAKLLEAAMELNAPVYIRLGREATSSLYPEDTKYEIGKALIPREGDDGAFICTGIMVHFAMEAAKRIHDELGKEIRVVDMFTIKPLDKQAVIDAAKTGRVVAAQDHNLLGGLGQLVGSCIAEAGIACKLVSRGCPDYFVPIANPEFLYARNGMDADGLYEAMKAMF